MKRLLLTLLLVSLFAAVLWPLLQWVWLLAHSPQYHWFWTTGWIIFSVIVYLLFLHAFVRSFFHRAFIGLWEGSYMKHIIAFFILLWLAISNKWR